MDAQGERKRLSLKQNDMESEPVSGLEPSENAKFERVNLQWRAPKRRLIGVGQTDSGGDFSNDGNGPGVILS
jgi:hypothetical protein